MFDVFLKWVYTIQRQRTKGDKKTMKKETLIKIAKEIRKQNHAMKDYYKTKGDEYTSNEYLVRACEWSFIINLLEDDNFCKIIAKNLHIKDAE